MAYAETDELFRKLQIRNPSDEQTAEAERVLEAAAGEIDAEIDLDADTTLEPWQLELAADVNLKRAIELWSEGAFGFLPIPGFVEGGARAGRNTWEAHAIKLAPLKSQWGIA